MLKRKCTLMAAGFALVYAIGAVVAFGVAGCDRTTGPVESHNYYEEAKDRALANNASGPNRNIVCFAYWNGMDSFDYDCVPADGGPTLSSAPEAYSFDLTAEEFEQWSALERDVCLNCNNGWNCDPGEEITVHAYWNPACQCWQYRVDWGACAPDYDCP